MSSISNAVPRGGWAAVIALRDATQAKRRLHLPPRFRVGLVRAMALDTVAAVLRCRDVTRVVLVTGDTPIADAARAHGVEVLRDAAAGLNQAFISGTQYLQAAGHRGGIALLPADLPAATPAEIDAALRVADGFGVGVVCDGHGTGTTLLTCRAFADARPRFGPGSFAAHRADGAQPVGDLQLRGLRCDVDTVSDLDLAVHLGLGSHSRRYMARTLMRPENYASRRLIHGYRDVLSGFEPVAGAAT